MSTILTIIAGIATAVGGYFKFKTNPNRLRRQAESDIAQKDAQIRDTKQEIKNAVYNQDDGKVNKLVSRLIPMIILMMMVGCQTSKIIYIPTDRRIESCTNSAGIACKAVPDAVLVEMLEQLADLQALKTEMAVDKRLSTTTK